MLFNSLEFFYFLPAAFTLYWATRRSLRVQNLAVVLASYVFYGWWDTRFLLLIALTTLASYASGLLIDKARSRTGRRWVCGANVVLNLAILAYFKYCDFFAQNFASLLRLAGMKADWVTLDIMLPVGISFYTFQALSYTIDVYRRRVPATRDAAAFFAYVSFFPQLVAGPIERATSLLPQFLRARSFSYPAAVDGMRQMLWGFFKKIVIADNCSWIVHHTWGSYSSMSGTAMLVGVVAFTIQIYSDFSGYSDIAIGAARLFGINLSRNFNYPFFSSNMREFWRRWHISLSTWLRDYVYIPMGGSRGSRMATARNIVVVFLLCGLWHGANWMFVLWGAYNALLLLPHTLFGRRKREPLGTPSLSRLGGMLVTFALCTFGFAIFGSNSWGEFTGVMGRVFSPSVLSMSVDFGPKQNFTAAATAVATAVMLAAEWAQRDKQHALQTPAPGQKRNLLSSAAGRWCAYLAIVLTIELVGAYKANFIYFQF